MLYLRALALTIVFTFVNAFLWFFSQVCRAWIALTLCLLAKRAVEWMRCIKHIPVSWGYPLLGRLDIGLPLSPEMDLHIQIMDIIKQHGSVVQMFWLNTHVVLVNDPELAYKVLHNTKEKTKLNVRSRA